MLSEESQAFYAIGCCMDFIPMAGKDSLQEIAVHAIIVNDQKLDHVPVRQEASDIRCLHASVS
jgi:hypothetical protein